MPGENQQFNKGKYGRLDSQAMNQVVRTAQQARNDREQAQTPFARDNRHTAGSFPMLVKIQDKVSIDGTIKGYKWIEANYVENQWTIEASGRAYNEEEQDYAVPLGIGAQEIIDTSFEDMFVHLNYTNTPDGIRLYFEPTGMGSGLAILKTSSFHYPSDENSPSNCSGFGSNRRYSVDRLILNPNFDGGGESGPTSNPNFVPYPSPPGVNYRRYAYNLLEKDGGIQLGGQTILTSECEVDKQTATIPINTMVLGKLIGVYSNTPEEGNGVYNQSQTITEIYAFTVANDMCITCCLEDSEGLIIRNSGRKRAALHAETRRRYFSPVSIFDEMIR